MPNKKYDLVAHYHIQGTVDLKRLRYSWVPGTAGWVLHLSLLTFLPIVSTFGSCASTFSLSSAMSVVIKFDHFSAVSFADRFIPALTFNKSLLSESATWLRWCVWATNLSTVSSTILTLRPFPLRLWPHFQYVLPLVSVLLLI